MMIVQTRDGINQIPIEDINLLLVSTTQAVITSALISKLAQNQTEVVFLLMKSIIQLPKRLIITLGHVMLIN